MADDQGKVQRINGDLHEVTPVRDDDGNVTHHIRRLHVELTPKDRVQIIVGASILAIPTAFTEEVWKLGRPRAHRSDKCLSGARRVP